MERSRQSNGGVEQPLTEFISQPEAIHGLRAPLRCIWSAGHGYQRWIVALTDGMNNPYRNGNLTEALRLEVENPELARQLQAKPRMNRAAVKPF